MRAIFLLAALSLATPAFGDAGATLFNVAPTTLDLKAGEAGLFYIANQSDKPVTVQIEALDWHQADGSDRLSASRNIFTSPPLAHIPPGARQTIRVLARAAGDGGEGAYRLRISELPGGAAGGNGIQVLMQFLVPVFVDHRDTAPQLAWAAREDHGQRMLTARNLGRQAVKLDDLALNGAAMPGGLVYILPGASHSFPAAGGPVHVSGHDARSGRSVDTDLP
jgi:fimbrial chaperone protein